MNEQELRALVREAVERHLGRPGERERARFSPDSSERKTAAQRSSVHPQSRSGAMSDHASHILLKVHPGSEIDDGMCVIEPKVRCNHCGFCQSYGH